ncbi:MAG: hypothetical protein ABW321_16045 [Polyangiales bacterium]
MKNFKHHSRIAIGFGAALAFAACSDSDSNTTEDGTGARVMVDPATAQAALTELTTNVDTTVTGYGGAGTTADGGGLTMRCSAGGDANVNGHVNVVPVPVNVDVQVAIDYNNCVTDSGTTLAGGIDFSQTVAAGAGQPVRVETIYAGNVVFTGRIQAECAVDLNVLVDEAGQTVQVAGQFCGQDAAALNLQISPRWGANAQVGVQAGQ